MPNPLPVNPAIMCHFDWEQVHGAAITGVVGQPGYYTTGGVFWWRLAILLEDRTIRISVNEDTDELIVTLESMVLPIGDAPLDLPWIDVAPLAVLVGHELGWSWVGRDSQGYLDTFTIAIDSIDPTWMFVGMASAVQIRRIALVEC